MRRMSLLTQRKHKNSPVSIYKYSFITVRHEVVGTYTINLSLFVYNMQLYIQQLKSAYYLKFYKFLSYGSK